jgi:hypothetical protein
MLREVHGHPQLCLPQAQDTRPAGVITVEAKTYRALECEHNIIELATFAVDATKLRELCLRIPLPPSLI